MLNAFFVLALALPPSSHTGGLPSLQTSAPSSSAVQVQFRKLQALAKRRLETERVAPRGAAGAAARGGKPITVVIDARMELFSIIFRLAGNGEFMSDGLQPYAAYIDVRFGPYRQHPAVQFARRMREERGVCCDAVVSLAIHLADVPGLKERAALENSALEQRWRPADARAFAELARTFAKESDFAAFFRESQTVYRLAEARMRRLVNQQIDQEWFARYFGERPQTRFIVGIGLLNGGMSYGVRVQPRRGAEEMHAVIGAWQFDDEGLPKFDESVTGTVVHEFNHSFVNPVVSRNESMFRAVGKVVHPKLAVVMRGMGYFEWKTTVEESLVRAVVARYLLAREGRNAAEAEVTQQMGLGFIWTDDVFALLADYEKERDKYPTFERFLPRIAEYFSGLPALLNAKLEKLDALRPKVISTIPSNGAEAVDPSLTEIKVTFDRAMVKGAYATVPGASGSEHFPAISQSRFDETGTVFTMRVKLKPSWTYELWLNSEMNTGFRSREGLALSPQVIRFRTRASGK
jgi:hypothetical protein